MILDTNALSGWWDDNPALVTLLSATSGIYVPVPALAEFRFGVLQSRKRDEMEKWMTLALATATILSVEAATTFHYAALRLHLQSAGTPIPMNDLSTAAIARQHQMPVVSRDTHFDLVPEIERISW